MILSLNETKAFLRVLHNEDDDYITSLIQTAKEQLLLRLNRDLKEFDPLPKSMKQWLLFKVMELYDLEMPKIDYNVLIESYRKIPV